MSRRIDIELTSVREDGTWTWRAAGAREPKGVLDGSLLFEGAAVGDVVKADAEFDVDGISVIAVLAPKSDARRQPLRIELLGPSRRDDEPLVTTQLAPKSARRGDRPGRRGDRREGDRRDGRDTRERRDRPGGGEGRDGRGRGEGRPGGGGSGDRDRRPRREPREEQPARPKPKRLRAGRAHRKAVLAELAPEQRLVAEQILAGGIPAVRQAVDKHNEEARTSGQPEIKVDQMIEMAERLLPSLRTADWRDRADAAMVDIDELDLRDLRAVVTASESVARDDEARALATSLREALTRREQEEQAVWMSDLTSALDDGRSVRALRISSRPPKAGTILAPDLMTRLAEAASASLTAETTPDRWNAVLDALAAAPVRKVAKPQSIPETVGDELRSIILRYASRVPTVAEAFGIEPPPEAPAGRGGRRAPGRSRPGAPGGSSGSGAVPRPPRPPAPKPAPAAPSKSVTGPTEVATSEAADPAPTTATEGGANGVSAPHEPAEATQATGDVSVTPDAPTEVAGAEEATEPAASDAATEQSPTDTTGSGSDEAGSGGSEQSEAEATTDA